jgi:hypothetical protein
MQVPHGLAARLAPAALIVVLGVAACGGGSDNGASNGTTTSSTAATTTTSTGTATTGAVSSCSTPQACAQALYDAWKKGDQAAAAQVAEPAAVTKMFSRPYKPIPTNSGPVDPYQSGPDCTGAAGSTICTWTGQDVKLEMRVRNATGGLSIRVIEVKLFEGSPLQEV